MKRDELINLSISMNEDASSGLISKDASFCTKEQEKIQELQRSLDQLQQSELRFKQLFNQSADPILLLGSQGFLDCNQSALALFGYSYKEQLCAIHPSQISPEFQADGQSSFDKANAMIAIAQATGSHQFEWLHQKLNGENFWAEVTLTLIPYDGEQILHSVVRDISTRKQTLIELEKFQTKLKFLMQGTPMGVIELNLEFAIVDWNPAAEKIFGYTATEMLHQPILRIVPEQYRHNVNDILQSLLDRGVGSYTIEENITKDGRLIISEWIDTPLLDEQGNTIGIYSMVHDITDRKRHELAIKQKSQELEQALQTLQQAQLQIIQSEKMSALGNLVAGVAHEINNPLGFIDGNLSQSTLAIKDILDCLQLYQKYFPVPGAEITAKIEEVELDYLLEDIPKMLESMQMGCDRIKAISASLRVFSRADQEIKVPGDIHAGIDSTLMILQHRLKAGNNRPAIQVVRNYGAIPSITCFLGQLNQVFMNIFANAIDSFDMASKSITLRQLAVNPQQITITTELISAQGLVVIKIKDNGDGMPESVKTRIFDHLFTTKDVGVGTGLGLAIAWQIIVDKHQGTLEVNSTPGQGAEFVITLPVERVEST